MALRVRISSVTGSGPYVVYAELYDEANPGAVIAKKAFKYTTSVTPAQVANVAKNTFKPNAVAYVNKQEIKTNLTAILTTVDIPKT